MVQEAIQFAIKAHDGQLRKGSEVPYIKHPLEAAVIVSDIRPEETLVTAAILHDTIEDCGVTESAIEEQFGSRVAQLVAAESDDKSRPWAERKQAMLEALEEAPEDVKIVALGDKLSNLRDICRDYQKTGDCVWKRFTAGSREMVGWYYKGLRKALGRLSGMPQYQEFSSLVGQMFDGKAPYRS